MDIITCTKYVTNVIKIRLRIGYYGIFEEGTMKIEDWKQIIKKAKHSLRYSTSGDFKVFKAQNGKRWFIYDVNSLAKCKTCGHCRSEPKTISIVFHNPKESLTQFEVGMLAHLFLENRLAADYAQWDRRQSGKEFIENIDTIMEL